MTNETAINLLDNLFGMVSDNHQNDYDEAFRMAIRSLKSWDEDIVTVVHGKWIRKGPEIYCSRCNFRFYPVMFKFCPGCGAKMEASE